MNDKTVRQIVSLSLGRLSLIFIAILALWVSFLGIAVAFDLEFARAFVTTKVRWVGGGTWALIAVVWWIKRNGEVAERLAISVVAVLVILGIFFPTLSQFTDWINAVLFFMVIIIVIFTFHFFWKECASSTNFERSE